MGSMRDRVRQRAETHASRSAGAVSLPDGVDRFEPKGKTMRLDIIPYRVSDAAHPQKIAIGEPWYERTFFSHFGIGPDNRPVVCPSSIGKPCPICEEWRRLKKDEGADQKAVDELKPRERQLYNVIDVDNDPDTIMVFESSYHTFGKQLEKEIDAGAAELGDFAEPVGGYTLSVRFEKKKFAGSDFLEADRIDFEPRDQDYDPSIIDSAVDLDACLTIHDYETLKEMFHGGGGGGETSEKEEAPPERPARLPRRGPASPAASEPATPPPATRRLPARAPAKPAAPPAEDPPGDDAGDAPRKVKWVYRDEEHIGEVIEELDEGAIRVKDEDDGRIKFLNEGDYTEVGEEAPPPAAPAPKARVPATRAPAAAPAKAATTTGAVTRRRRIDE